MHGSCGNENSVAGLWSEESKMISHCSRGERLAHGARRSIRRQSRIDAAFRSSRHNHPCFSLAALTRGQIGRLRIRRVYLNRQGPAYIEKFEQQWETAEALGPLSQ